MIETGPTQAPPADAPAEAPRAFERRLSQPGLVVAALFFALSLAPSLLPRTGVFQGVVSGVTTIIGYGFGVFGAWLWCYLGVPVPSRGTRPWKFLIWVPVAAVAVITVLAVWRQVGWQNDVRERFGMPSISPAVWLPIVPVTLLVALLLLITGRAIRRLFRNVAGRVERRLPRRVARVIGVLAVTLLLWGLLSGVIVDGVFAAANRSFSVRDTSTVEGLTRPTSALRSGGPGSVVPWDTLGRQGRRFVATGATVDELNEASGGGAKEPIRVYAGLKSADDVEGRADLVLKELQRTGAFDRKILVIATTTGTGYLTPNAVNSLEYLYNGDTAIVGVQYSYLPSWISILADQQVTKDTSRVVFDKVHAYWSTLPTSSRPKLYLFGLSLGSFGVESILTSINVLNAPIDGALLVGPPFVNSLWNELTDDRDAGSPASLPIYENGRTVRFTALRNALGVPTAEWGPTKVAYLQHASDPVTFFTPRLAYSKPEWLKDGQRGPDVSDEMDWFPIVTMWQVLLDMPVAGNVPAGYGHLFKSREYLDAWAGITQPAGWTDAAESRIAAILERREHDIAE